ncbi:MAG: hypothetical protein KU38_04250 [Sulfurovum sp. FS08-3]|nr:MAG: hypothetical protein KU38_04250 [Sulfurovum sp. FS08-3]
MFCITFSHAKESSSIILSTHQSPSDATVALAKANQNTLIQELAKRFEFKVTIEKQENELLIILTNFKNPKTIPLVYEVLKRDYHTLKTNYRVIKNNTGSDIVWLAVIFVMFGTIGVIFIVRSSKKYNELEMEYKKLKKIKDSLSAKHDEVLNNLGYKIEKTTKSLISARDEIINEPITEYTKEVVEKKFQSIQETDKILTDTTEQIINFLKAKSGKLKLQHKSFDINKLLDEITAFVFQNFKGKAVELIYDINIDVPRYIMGDINRLSELLMNILDYSFRHTSRGYIKLVIAKFDHVRVDTALIEFKIVDTSTGVKKEQEDAIFTPFSNNDNQRGLFITKELVRLMKGELEFVSRYGKGNTFSITIPLHIDDKRKQSYALSSDSISHKELEKRYVGIIDKDEESAMALKKSFLHFTKNVSTVADYSLNDYDVLNRFDLLLIDHSMLYDETFELIKTIQKHKELKLIITHSMLNNNYAEVVDEQIERYISKPLTPSYAQKIFLDIFSQLKVVSSEDEMIYMEQMRNKQSSNLPKQYPKPMVDTKDATPEFFKEFAQNSILIINDDKITLNILREIIGNSGIRCALASNAQETFEQLGKYYHNFNLIIINIEKESTNGYLLTKMIRSSHAYDKIPIIAIITTPYNPSELLKAGINAYLLKPIRLTSIYTAFNLFLDKVDLGSPYIRLSEQILDITRGIMQTQHDYRVYLELVKEFKDAYGNSATQLKTLMDAKDYDRLKEMINNMLGLSDILGANNMFALLKKLDQMIRNKEYDTLENSIDEFNEELEALNTNIEIYIRSVKS